MKSTTILCLALSTITLAPAAQAVSEAACIWLMVSPSTRASGMGNTFSPLNDDSFNAWLAPGSEVLRPLSSWAELDLSGYPGDVDWLPAFRLDDVYLRNQALSLRADLNEAARRAGLDWHSEVPTQLSVSYTHVLLNEGERTRTDEEGNILGTVNPVEQSHSLRLALGQRRERWAIGLGLGLDHVISDLASGVLIGDQWAEVGRSTTVDAGVNLQANPLPRQWLNPADPAAGYLDWTLGLQYSKLFLGSHISYADEAEADPMPFHDRLALASRWRVALPAVGDVPELPVLEAHVALERSVQLIDVNRHWVVAGIRDDQPGGYWDDQTDAQDDISYDKHYTAFDERLLAGGSETVTRSQGWELGVLGSFYVRGGSYVDRAGHIDETTEGWGLRSGGLANWILRTHPELGHGLSSQLLRRLDIRYDVARLDSGSPRDDTRYHELSLRWSF